MTIGSHPNISIERQCELLDLARSSYYYQPQGESDFNLELMRVMGDYHTLHPEWGRLMMTANLQRAGYLVNHKRVGRLMKLMRIRSVLPKPKLSLGNKEHKIYPYLLRDRKIETVNEVWSTDITYIPMPKGFMYLTAIIDWFSRYVLSWELSNSLENSFCIHALEAALQKAKPEIFNTDQGSQFTSYSFTKRLLSQEIKISMDGKGRALDNIFVERLWRTVKYDFLYLHAFENGKELYQGLKYYFDYYNNRRLHSSLEYKTPAEVYFSN